MLFLYRSGILKNFEILGQHFEVKSTRALINGKVVFENLNDIKTTIVKVFKDDRILHSLMDPIEFCKQITQLKDEVKQLGDSLKNEKIIHLKEIDALNKALELEKTSHVEALQKMKDDFSVREEKREAQMKEYRNLFETQLADQNRIHEQYRDDLKTRAAEAEQVIR